MFLIVTIIVAVAGLIAYLTLAVAATISGKQVITRITQHPIAKPYDWDGDAGYAQGFYDRDDGPLRDHWADYLDDDLDKEFPEDHLR